MAAPTVAGISSTGNWEADGSIVADLQGAATGRLLLAGTFVRLAAQTVNLPSASPGAWTLKSGDNETATATSGEIAGKVAGGSETAPTLSSGLTAGPQGTGGIVISVDGWSGTLTDVVVSTPNGGASTTIPAPSVASAPDQSLVIRVYFNADNNTITNDAGAGGTQIFTQVVGTLGRLALHVYAGVQSGTGATGAASLVVSGSDGYLAWTIVVPPAAGGGTLSLSGSVTATGALVKQVTKTTAGSTTPTGALLRALSRLLGGSATPAGALVKRPNKPLAGSTTPTGTLTPLKTFVLALAGSVTATGALVRQVAKQVAGSTTTTGLVRRVTAKRLTGGVTAGGGLLKLLSRLLGGSTTPAGTLATGQPGAVRDLQVSLGPPQTGWRLGSPGTAWSTGSPRTNWDLGPPEA